MVRGAAKAHAQEKNAAKQAAMKAGVSTKGVDVAGANAKAIQERELKRAAKEEAEKAKAAKEAAAKKKLEREAKAREKGGAAKAAPGGGAGGLSDSDAQLKQLESQLMPLVKKGDALQESGDLDGALALYQEAMDGFRGAGFKRPKLKEKLDAVKEMIARAEPAPEPANQSVEVDQSVEVAGDDEC